MKAGFKDIEVIDILDGIAPSHVVIILFLKKKKDLTYNEPAVFYVTRRLMYLRKDYLKNHIFWK